MIVLFFPDNMAATMATWLFCASGQGWQRWREWLVRKRDSLCILERPAESFHPASERRRHLTKRCLNTGFLDVWGGMGEVRSTFNNCLRSGLHHYRKNMTLTLPWTARQLNQTSYPRTLSGVTGIGSQVTSMSAADRLFADTLSGGMLGTAKEQRNVEALIQKAFQSQRGKIGLSQRMKPRSHLREALLHFNGNCDWQRRRQSAGKIQLTL